MSKKDRGSFPFAPSVAYELQMHACYFQSEDTDVIKYAGDLLQSIEFFLSEINTQKKYLKIQHEEGKQLQWKL